MKKEAITKRLKPQKKANYYYNIVPSTHNNRQYSQMSSPWLLNAIKLG